VHLRRALLLFAIVLGLAAIAASVSRPRDADDRTESLRTSPATTETERGPPAEPAPDRPPSTAELTFSTRDPGAQRVRAGQAVTVLVEVEEPGQVEIADLGVSAAAQPLTPARFDVLTRTGGRYRITFTPAAEGEPVGAGTLVVAAER
jgi:hypothetical protein